MLIFVYEYFCGGGLLGDRKDPSLSREGFAMLASIAADLHAIQGTQVVTMMDRRFAGHCSTESLEARVQFVDETTEGLVYRELCQQADQCIVIAPESAGILADRCRIADRDSPCRVGSHVSAIELTSDKLVTSHHLHKSGVRAAGGIAVDPRDGLPEFDQFPAVLKPRDGAGSQMTYLIDSPDMMKRIADRAVQDGLGRGAVLQPFVAGIHVSVSCLVGQGPAIALPACYQRLDMNEAISYLGGAGPVDDADQCRARQLALRAVNAVPGLAGYVGVDMVLATEPDHDAVIEINPRFTTSYIMLRELTRSNLANCMLGVFHGTASPMEFIPNQTCSFHLDQGELVIHRER